MANNRKDGSNIISCKRYQTLKYIKKNNFFSYYLKYKGMTKNKKRGEKNKV